MEKRDKYTFEYILKTGDDLLYKYLFEPSNLVTWFAKNVEIISKDEKEKVYLFKWEGGGEERAKLVRKVYRKKVVFEWLDRDEATGERLIMSILRNNMTKMTALIISDYDFVDEFDQAKMMWDNMIRRLKNTIGA